MMKRTICIALALMLFLGGASLAETVTEKPRNTVGITIYNQDDYDGPKWQLYGFEGRTLSRAGCYLFTYAYAQQWLTGVNRGDDLINELICVCRDPNGKYDHARCTHGYIDGQAFYPFNKCQGFPMDNDDLPEMDSLGHPTVEGMKEFFSRGKRAMVIHGANHHILAVEEMVLDGVSYVHIIDSHWESIRERTGKDYFYLETDAESGKTYMQPIKVDQSTLGMGSDYWMKTADVCGIFRLIFAWKLNPEWTPHKN